MTFAWPWALALIALPAIWLARALRRKAVQTARSRPHLLEAEAGPAGVTLAAGVPAKGRPPILLACGLVLAIVALARPQWGAASRPEVSRSREILIGLDLSRSMLSTDVKPSRLARSKLLIRSLLDHLAGERVGLELFAGTAFLQAPMSSDYEILREFLPHLNPSYLPVGGTDYGALIDTAAGAFGSGEADRYLIVLSDGGATDEGWRTHIPELTRKGIRVIALGVGTEAGGFIPDGAGGFVKDERGAVVLARLDSTGLRELAAKTGGVYRDAGEWVDLPQLLRSTIKAGRKGVFTEREREVRIERYQWALAPALLLLLLSFWKELPVRPKARD
ncbi:MAG: VWA domain-containing protein, partial [Opitutaceae bacterium]